MAIVMREKGCMWSTVGYYLVLVGAVNWGLVGAGYFFGENWNLVNLLFGMWPVAEYVVYVLVGVAGVMTLVGCKCKTCAACRVEGGEAPKM